MAATRMSRQKPPADEAVPAEACSLCWVSDTPTRERVLATLVRLLDTTWVRIGNEAYARDNGSYGLTTLQNRHARLQGDALRLSFQGKSGVRHALALSDRAWPASCGAVANCHAEGCLPRGTLGAVVAEMAARLGNTPAVCRKSHVHPAVLALCETEAACELLASDWLQSPPPPPPPQRGLSLAERQLMALLSHGAVCH